MTAGSARGAYSFWLGLDVEDEEGVQEQDKLEGAWGMAWRDSRGWLKCGGMGEEGLSLKGVWCAISARITISLSMRYRDYTT